MDGTRELAILKSGIREINHLNEARTGMSVDENL